MSVATGADEWVYVIDQVLGAYESREKENQDDRQNAFHTPPSRLAKCR
jgi:hypothetical protein